MNSKNLNIQTINHSLENINISVPVAKAVEMAIIRSIEDVLDAPLGPGLVKTRFEFIKIIVGTELGKFLINSPKFFIENKDDLSNHLNIVTGIMGFLPGEHKIGITIAFCVSLIKRSKSIYDPKLMEYLLGLLYHYEQEDNKSYKLVYEGEDFEGAWAFVDKITTEGSTLN